MKVRYGFVSNSSSSSFTCGVCGEIKAGWDMGMMEANMVRCLNDHTVCEQHVENLDEATEIMEQGEWGYDPSELPVEYCPVCKFKVMDDHDVVMYALKRAGFSSKKEAAEHILKQFPDYEHFKDYVYNGGSE